MTLLECRIVPFRKADGPANMAWDEAILRSVIADPTTAWLRLYGWTEPTLSLGYFQETHQRESDPRWRNAPTVRRMTGGGAIWHDRELTYSLALPAKHPFVKQSILAYQAVHDAIGRLLLNYGIPAQRREMTPDFTKPPVAPRPFLCFLDQDPNDLVVGGIKIVGSAQRRRDRSLLQHGSLMIQASRQTPELLGVADLAPQETYGLNQPEAWINPVRHIILESLELAYREAHTEEIKRLSDSAQELDRQIYRTSEWTRRR